MATFVLVHGGFCGGWSWKLCTPLLEKKNNHVYALTLSGLGDRNHVNSPHINLDTHILDVRNLIEFEDLNDVILVGHSYGGLVITGVATQISERIKRLIYLDALIPDTNDSVLTLVDPETKDFFIASANEKGNGWEIPPFHYPDDYFKDKKIFEWCSPRVTPQSLASFAQPIIFSEDAIKNIPKAFIRCTKSTPIMKTMEAKAQKKGARCFEIESNHFPMLENPQELCDLLEKIVAQE